MARDSVSLSFPSIRQGKLAKVNPKSFLSLLNHESRSEQILFLQLVLVQVRSSLGTCPKPLIPQQPNIICCYSGSIKNKIKIILYQKFVKSFKYINLFTKRKLDLISQCLQSPIHLQIKDLNMELTQNWQKQSQVDVEGDTAEAQLQQSNNRRDIKKQIISEHASQHIAEQIQDDLTALRNKNNQTPLVFYGKVGSTFLFSFNKSQVPAFMARFAIFSIFLIGVQIFVQQQANVSKEVKAALIIILSIHILSFLLLFYLDPGTLIEDQPQKLNQQRLYCQDCRIYKNYKTFHCKLCLKCVRGYDHHCGFFGKCIGRRNYLLYCLFLLMSGIGGIGCMGSLIYTLLHNIISKHN